MCIRDRDISVKSFQQEETDGVLKQYRNDETEEGIHYAELDVYKRQPRNFGRRGATEMWPQRKGSSNCLAKTQVYAKPKGEVYGLTPARCWKVTRRGGGTCIGVDSMQG